MLCVGGGVVVKNRSLAALSATSAALLVLAIVDPWTQPEPYRMGRVFPSVFVGQSSSLQVTSPSGVLRIKKDDSGKWFFVPADSGTSDGMQVDGEQVDRFLSTLRILHSLRVDSDGDGKRANASEGKLEIEGIAGQKLELELGQRSSDGQARWIGRRLEPEGEKRYVLVEEYLVRELLESSRGWKSHRLFHWSPKEVESIHLSEEGRTIQIGQGEIQWQAEQGIVSGRTDVTRFWKSVDSLSALRFDEFSAGDCPANAPVLTISAGGETVVISDCGGCEESGQRLQAGKRNACVSQETWQDIRQMVDTPEYFASTALLPPSFWSERFQVDCGGQRQDVDPTAVDFSALRIWAKKFQASIGPLQEVQPFVPVCVLRGRDWELAIGKAEEQWLAQRAGDRGQYRLQAGVEPLVRSQSFQFRSLEALPEDPIFASSISVARDGKIVQLIGGEILERWTMADSVNNTLATKVGVALTRALTGLRFESFVQEGDSLSVNDSFLLAIEFKARVLGKRRNYQFRIQGEGSACRVQLADGPIGIPSAELCEKILGAIDLLWNAP